MSTHANMVWATAASPGTGTITVSTAVSGYRTFAQGYNNADATVSGIRIEDAADSTIWEVARNCSYTYSTNALTRGTFENSSTGSAVNFTGAVVVSVVATADKGTRIERALKAVTPGGRLTLESNVPVSTTDQTAKTNIYYTPYVHNIINLWDGTDWVPTTFTEYTLALGTLTTSREYNVFAYSNSGALACVAEILASATVTFTNGTDVVNWTSTPAVDGDMVSFKRGTMPTGLTHNTVYYVRDKTADSFKLAATVGGAAINFTTDGSGTITATIQNVTLQDGRYCKNGDKTKLLLGSFYTATATTTEDSLVNALLDNVYNPVPRRAYTYATGGTYSGTERKFNNNDDSLSKIMVSVPKTVSIAVWASIMGATATGSTVGLLIEGEYTILDKVGSFGLAGQIALGSSIIVYAWPAGLHTVQLSQMSDAGTSTFYEASFSVDHLR